MWPFVLQLGLALPQPVLVSAEAGMELAPLHVVSQSGFLPGIGVGEKSYLVTWFEETKERRIHQLKRCVYVKAFSLEGQPVEDARNIYCDWSLSKLAVLTIGERFFVSWQSAGAWVDWRGGAAEVTYDGPRPKNKTSRIKCNSEGRCYARYAKPEHGRRYLDFETQGFRARDIVEAHGIHGSLFAWSQEKRRGSDRRVAIGYLHPDPDAAQPHHVAIANGLRPAVATLNGKDFGITYMAGFRGPVHFRLLKVNPQAFAKAAQPRGAVLTGTLLDPDRTPSRVGRLHYALRLAGGGATHGSTKVGEDGTFAIKHPMPHDRSAKSELKSLMVWAVATDYFAPARMVDSVKEPILLVMHPMPRKLGSMDISVVDAATGKPWPTQVHLGVIPGGMFQNTSGVLVPGHRHRFHSLVPGLQQVVITNDKGFSATVPVRPPVGEQTHYAVPFVTLLPPGTVGVILAQAQERMVVRAVAPGSGAQQAGVRAKDVMTHVGGKPFTAMQHIERLRGEPGSKVDVTVMRGRETLRFTLVRAPKEQDIVARVIDDAAASVKLVKNEHDEKKAPFRVRIDQDMTILSTLRVTLSFDERIDEKASVPVTMTLRDPLGNVSTKSFQYYNQVSGHVGCDPVPGGGPDQCKNTYFERAAAGPRMEFEGYLLREPGKYYLTVSYAGQDVHQEFNVAPYSR